VRGSPHGRKWWATLVGLGAVALATALVLALVLAGSGPPTRTAARRPGSGSGSGAGSGSGSGAGSGSGGSTAGSTGSSATTTSSAGSTTTARATLTPAQPAPTIEQFGASVNLLFNSATNTDQLITAQLDALRASGASLARSDALWEAAEPSAPVAGVHSFDWAFDDRIAGDLAAHGMSWLPILGYSAPWAQSIPGQDHSPPSSSADYAAYAGAFAARYGPAGAFWRAHPGLPVEPVATYEIWNEPDNGEFWTPTPDPARYADLYIAAREAIDTADPTARVIVGGLTNATSFLPAILAARPGLRGHIDGVAIHPYGAPGVVLAKIRSARAILVALGMERVPLYATEFGWTTTPPGALDYVPADRRPAYIADTVAALGHLDCGLAASLLYTWYSPQQNPADSQQWYGIDSLTGGATADADAFAQGLRRARAPARALRICG
jgi:polysaccharide biosynthesis protein PslG